MYLSSYPYSVLLQTTITAPLSEVQSWGPGVVAVASLALTVYLNMRKENREDGLTMAQRLKKTEIGLLDVGLRQTGMQLEVERVADAGRQDRNTIRDEHRRDYDVVKEQMTGLVGLRDIVMRMVEKSENQAKSFDNLEQKTAKGFERLDAKVDSIIFMLRKV